MSKRAPKESEADVLLRAAAPEMFRALKLAARRSDLARASGHGTSHSRQCGGADGHEDCNCGEDEAYQAVADALLLATVGR